MHTLQQLIWSQGCIYNTIIWNHDKGNG